MEYFLTEEEVTHTETRRDEAMETGRWGLVKEVDVLDLNLEIATVLTKSDCI